MLASGCGRIPTITPGTSGGMHIVVKTLTGNTIALYGEAIYIMRWQITVKTLTGNTITLDVKANDSIRSFCPAGVLPHPGHVVLAVRGTARLDGSFV